MAVAAARSEVLEPVFASRWTDESLPKYRLPDKGMPAPVAKQLVADELELDANPRLNLASFVTTFQEEEAVSLFMRSMNTNYVDMDLYPSTTELQNRCVNILANLFHAPMEEGEGATGTSAVGSSEAIMLAGLALKWAWR